MDILWQIIYWGNLLQGSFVTKFFQKYWVSGHFSIGSRIKATLKQLLIMMLAVIIFVAILASLAYFYMKDFIKQHKGHAMEIAKAGTLVMANMYGTLLLVILLSYGLVFLPFSVWKRSNNSQLVYEDLIAADLTF